MEANAGESKLITLVGETATVSRAAAAQSLRDPRQLWHVSTPNVDADLLAQILWGSEM